MKKIAIFTGAGISQESGVPTFRDTGDGLWYNYKVEEVATKEGWQRSREKVIEFHNMLRAKLKEVHPNDAHKALVKLEERFDVTIVTQNVDDLHERAGSTNVLHLHGELFKSRSSLDDKLLYECKDRIEIGDKCEKGSQLRPHTVLFGEYPYNVYESMCAVHDADYLLIIGTSLQISYTLDLLNKAQPETKIIYIDPKPMKYLDNYGRKVTYVKKTAVAGVNEVVNKILNNKL